MLSAYDAQHKQYAMYDGQMYDCRIGLNTDVQSLHWSSQWCAIRFARLKAKHCGYKVPRQAVLCMIIYNYAVWYCLSENVKSSVICEIAGCNKSIYENIYNIFSIIYRLLQHFRNISTIVDLSTFLLYEMSTVSMGVVTVFTISPIANYSHCNKCNMSLTVFCHAFVRLSLHNVGNGSTVSR